MNAILTNKKDKEGKQLYFVGYSKMRSNNKPLLLLAADPENKNTYGQYSPDIEIFKLIIAACKTDNQVLKAVAAAGYTVKKDDSQDIGFFSIWLSDTLRIYKRRKQEYILQQWEKVSIEYSGIPTFFATNSYF